MKPPIILDFETEGIARRPHYPPKPVSFSIELPGKAREFFAWGHPSENGHYVRSKSGSLIKLGDVTEEKAKRVLRDQFKQALRQSGHSLLFQNGKFDVDVAETFCDAPRVPWEKIHDTLFLIFLHDPHAKTFSLKPTANRLLGMAPEEQDAVKQWVLAHVPEAKRRPSEWGAYICRAPGKLVGKYADGDILRTKKLFNYLHPIISRESMLEAYDRERQLMPILLETERQGLRCDLRGMERDYSMYQQALGVADNWLRKKLKRPDLNLDADANVAEALDDNDIVSEWVMTKTGKKSVAKKNMSLDLFSNKQIASVYGYRVRLATCLRMFFEPWLEMARESGGLIYTTWNQVRQSGGDGNVGARTGRLSSSPNLQNVPTDFLDKGDHYTNPDFLKALPPLPFMRKYILPNPGCVWIKRDYSQQEIRILAHYEDGYLLNKYNNNPDYDLHADVKAAIKEYAGLDLPRGQVKILNFGDIYGMGFSAFHEKTKVAKADYDKIKAAKKTLLPDLAELDDSIKQRGKQDMPIRTWGGRIYKCEPPMFSKKFGRMMSFEYKLLNYLIQGSAADCTKQAVINYHNHPKRNATFLLTVHDELNACCPKKDWRVQQAILAESMADVKFDCAMKSDGGVGANWHNLKDCD